MRHLINAGLAVTALHVLNTVFKAVPDHAAARFAVLEAERVQRVRQLERQKCLTLAAKIRAAGRAAEWGLEDWHYFETAFDWDEAEL